MIVSQWSQLQGPHQKSSHSFGVIDIFQLGHPKLAFLVLLGNAFKTIVPLLIAKSQGVGSGNLAWLIVAITLGHMFPIFFHFRGGQGIATTLSGLLIVSWPIGLLTITAWIIVFICFQYASLASLASILSMLFLTLCLGPIKTHTPIALLAGLLLTRHSQNWVRLWTGCESKIQIAKYFHS